MAHFAKINDDNIVEQVIVVNNSDCGGGDFPESDPIGNTFLNSIGLTGNWKQTSYNNNFRKQYAGLGFTYDSVNDIFINPRPYPSWSLNENFDWIPPIPYPEDSHELHYHWNEENQSWYLVNP